MWLGEACRYPVMTPDGKVSETAHASVYVCNWIALLGTGNSADQLYFKRKLF